MPRDDLQELWRQGVPGDELVAEAGRRARRGLRRFGWTLAWELAWAAGAGAAGIAHLLAFGRGAADAVAGAVLLAAGAAALAAGLREAWLLRGADPAGPVVAQHELVLRLQLARLQHLRGGLVVGFATWVVLPVILGRVLLDLDVVRVAGGWVLANLVLGLAVGLAAAAWLPTGRGRRLREALSDDSLRVARAALEEARRFARPVGP